jgi:pimeloyl-ACP methyl ester carboxylesterase
MFAPERYRLFLLDLKGSGLSSKPQDGLYGPTTHAAIVAAFLEAHELNGAVLVGHSFGGAVALLTYLKSLAEGERARIGRLILIDCAVYPQKIPRFIGYLRIPLFGHLLLKAIPVRFGVSQMLNRIFRNKRAITPERIERYASCFGKKSTYPLIQGARQLLPPDSAELVRRYREIDLPTLIIWGREDPLISIEQGVRLQGELPHARLAVLENCGHNPHEEWPEQTFAVMDEFLTSGQTGGSGVSDPAGK